MSEAAAEARRHFDALWQREAPAWRAGRITPVTMRDGVCLPFDLGLTSIARAVEQSRAPALGALAERLRAVAPAQFIYGPDQHHITLVGFVPRFAVPEEVPPERIDRLRGAVAVALADAAPVTFDLVGLGVLGPQVFIQVVPRARHWQELRERTIEALTPASESAQRFPSTAPIHMNVLRVTDARPSALAELFAAVEAWHDEPFGTLVVDAVAMVMTDFVVTPRHTRRFAAFSLNAPAAR
jgi:2'-5' RNA ligase